MCVWTACSPPDYRSSGCRSAPSNDSRKTHLASDFLDLTCLEDDLLLLLFLLSFLLLLLFRLNSLTNDVKRCIASSSVSSDMLAKHTLNHPGSVQWQDDPGEIFSLTS